MVDAALVLGATLRLTRFVVNDDLGEWWVKAPIYRAVLSRVPEERIGHASNYLDGLSCPFCVGYWIGVGVLASRSESSAWRFVAGTLTLNYLSGHISSRLDAE